MKPNVKLLYIGNHDPQKWHPSQREGWDEIQFIPFPEVDPTLSRAEVMEIAKELAVDIIKWLDNPTNFVCIQGEYSLFFFVIIELVKNNCDLSRIVFPTTRREVIEEVDANGATKKTAVFKFVKWR